MYREPFHITYCTNIHPGQDWQSTWDSIRHFGPLIKAKVSPAAPFGLGLRLSNKASEELGTGDRLKEFKNWLESQGLYVFTMNGFPYGNFHNEIVKAGVHAPDWTSRERVAYTSRLFRQLAILLPEGITGGISTSPVSYKHWHETEEKKQKALQQGAEHMAEIVILLHQIEEDTGTYLHLDLEPEPDGLLENGADVLAFFEGFLLPIASDRLKKELKLNAQLSRELILRHLCLCYDICHFSLAFEEPEITFASMEKAGIGIGKIQVSAALKILSGPTEDHKLWEALARFNEPTYLHQVTEQAGAGIRTWADLPELLAEAKPFKELRAHFHVPVFMDRFKPLYSTQDHILKVLDFLKTHPITDHLEIETYTWEVLPEEMKPELSECITREINWLTTHL